MEIITSYKCRIVKCSANKDVLSDTINIYRQMVLFCIAGINENWDNFIGLDSREKNNYANNLFHKTQKNPEPKYDFDARFYKCPSYLRRCAIAAVIGHVSSYRSNLAKWENEQSKKKKKKKSDEPKAPTLSECVSDYPCMYRDNMFIKDSPDTVRLKVYKDNDWKWITVKLRHTDVAYIEKHCKDKKEGCPTLVKKGKVCSLAFTYKEESSLVEKSPLDYIVVGVDLGLNTHAVCSVMDNEGTVCARKFIDIAYEKDQLAHTLNRIKKFQRLHKNTDALWRKAKYLNSEISRKTAKGIIDFAIANHADCIVFEYLNVRGKKRGGKKQLLHHWKCQEIQGIVTLRTHQNGMHISHICAWGTSALAFDGSGKVKRDEDNHSLCTFANGKRYNCDLSASYNIAARFFLREYAKKDNSLDKIKITQRTLQTLKDYSKSGSVKAV